MPRTAQKASFELTWDDLRLAEEEYSGHYQCRIEWGASWVRYSAKSERKYLIIQCFAIRGPEGHRRTIGCGNCGYRTGRGAASVPGAYLRSMIDACEDLAQRLADPRYNRDTPVAPLPGSQPQ
jgi:hypothetical protein